MVCAFSFALQFFVAATGLQLYAQDWLCASELKADREPEWIVILGAGLPTRDGFLRAYWGSEYAKQYPEARLVVTLLVDDGRGGAQVEAYRRELEIRGVDVTRVEFVTTARSTREEAVEVLGVIGDCKRRRLMIVTSEMHVRRAVLAFRTVGCELAAGGPAREIFYATDIGHGGLVRYGFWYSFSSLPLIVRELAALAYYRIRGWA